MDKDMKHIFNKYDDFIERNKEFLFKKEVKNDHENIIYMKLLISSNIENFILYFINKLGEGEEAKKIIFIRHGQAEHNYYNMYLRKEGKE